MSLLTNIQAYYKLESDGTDSVGTLGTASGTAPTYNAGKIENGGSFASASSQYLETAAYAGSYLDLVYIMGANNSDTAVTVDIRPVTAGNIVMTLQVPANGVAGIACPMPLPQGDPGNNWTADMGDITGASVYLTALFSKEV